MELHARRTYAKHMIWANRPIQAYHQSGGFYPTNDWEKLKEGPEGPGNYDYQSFSGIYCYRPTRTLSMVDRFDFLFADNFSRKSLPEIIELQASQPEAHYLLVLGGSLAQGSSAKSADSCWHKLLEDKLRIQSGQNIHVINAALGSFVSFQERLTLEALIGSLKISSIVILNGFNDLVLPLLQGSRPGDPYQMGSRYQQVYDNSFSRFLRERSHFLKYRYLKRIEEVFSKNAQEIADSVQPARYLSDSIIGIYSENTVRMIEVAHSKNIPIRIFFQPIRDMEKERFGYEIDHPLHSFHANAYRLLIQRCTMGKWGKSYTDISELLDSKDQLSYFVDECHLNDFGQKALAKRISKNILHFFK